MLTACRLLHYLFESGTNVERCPNCGKRAVRRAIVEERKDFELREVEMCIKACYDK